MPSGPSAPDGKNWQIESSRCHFRRANSRLLGAYQLAITIGLLIAAIVDHSTANRNDSGSYRIPIAVQFAWGLIIFFGMLLLPETPRMHIKRGHPDRAAKSLSRLRRLDIDHPSIVEELGEITANHEYETALGKATYLYGFHDHICCQRRFHVPRIIPGRDMGS